MKPDILIVIAALDEADRIVSTLAALASAFPGAPVWVADDGSTDATAETARQAGARVLREPRAGKGFALLAGFREAKGADYFVMVDGDDTYPAEDVVKLLAAAQGGADMVVGTRLAGAEQGLALRGEPELVAALGERVVQRLDAERVASAEQLLVARVPDGERVHAAQPPQRVLALRGEHLEQHFGV